MLVQELVSMNVFNSFDNWETSFLIKVYRHSGFFFDRHVVAFFEASFSKEVRTL